MTTNIQSPATSDPEAGNTSPLAQGPGNANLGRLYVMRNLAIGSQLGVIILARELYRIRLPLVPLLAIITSLAIVNALTWLRLRTDPECGNGEFLLQLLVDIGALTAVLYFTGGATNPFVGLFLLPLTVAATVLQRYSVWMVAGITVCAYSWLLGHYVPLPASVNATTLGFNPMVVGMWLRFVINSVLVAYFVVSMAEALRQRDRTLAQTREENLHNARLAALGMLSAGTAHELGTPLATLATLTGELRREYQGAQHGSLRGALDVMRTQIDRCKEALAEVSASAGELQAQAGNAVPVRAYLLQTINEWRKMRPGIAVAPRLEGPASSPCIVTERTLSQAIMTVLNNAADASPDAVELKAVWDDNHLTLEIRDRGCGLSHAASKTVGQAPFSTKEHGLGLGLYLAHAAIKRLGGDVLLADRPGGGTSARVNLPLRQLVTN
ncbi:MAG: ATP-binding protein [Gammaproteobacteria bacterium]|jgi:two-component system, sensor histidine kinase RegB